jgi:hypothetical protein
MTGGYDNIDSGKDPDITLNNAHRTGDGSDHADVATNTTHSTGDGSDHADVATNTVHSTGDGKSHSDVVLNNAHRISDGSDHSRLGQDVSPTASPSFPKVFTDEVDEKTTDNGVLIQAILLKDGTLIPVSGDLIIKLGDAAGANKLIIQDSTGTPVATTDSNGVRQEQIGTDSVHNVRNASGTSKVSLSAVGDGHIENSGLTRKAKSADLADDAEFVLDASVTGFGFAQAGDNEEWALFGFTSAGVVNLIQASANTVTTDTDTKFCIYQSGTSVAIKNRLGAQKKVQYEINFS